MRSILLPRRRCPWPRGRIVVHVPCGPHATVPGLPRCAARRMVGHASRSRRPGGAVPLEAKALPAIERRARGFGISRDLCTREGCAAAGTGSAAAIGVLRGIVPPGDRASVDDRRLRRHGGPCRRRPLRAGTLVTDITEVDRAGCGRQMLWPT